ncbi:MAG: hypothetical protein ACLUOI_01910 [Eisenbergiella sp.]
MEFASRMKAFGLYNRHQTDRTGKPDCMDEMDTAENLRSVWPRPMVAVCLPGTRETFLFSERQFAAMRRSRL